MGKLISFPQRRKLLINPKENSVMFVEHRQMKYKIQKPGMLLKRALFLILFFSYSAHSQTSVNTSEEALFEECKKLRPSDNNHFHRTTHVVAACNKLRVRKVDRRATRSPEKINVCIFREESGMVSEDKEIAVLGYVQDNRGKLAANVGVAFDYGDWPMDPAKETSETIQAEGGHNGGSVGFLYNKKNATLRLKIERYDPKSKKPLEQRRQRLLAST